MSPVFTPEQSARILAACVSGGFDFGKLCNVQLFPHICRQFVAGQLSEKQFIDMLGKLNIFNGGAMKL